MKWTTKARILRVLSAIPLGKTVYYHVGQRCLGYLRNFTIDEKVRKGTALLKCLDEIGGTIADSTAVDIGTGWVPVVPLLYWLYGQTACHTFDISRLVKLSLFLQAA